MKKHFICLIIFISVSSFAQSQSKLDLLQGIWSYNMNSDTIKSYKLVSKNKCIDIGYSFVDNRETEFFLMEMIIGFQDSVKWSDDNTFIHTDSMKENGTYFTEILRSEFIEPDGFINKAFCMIASYYECDGELLSINGGKLFEYDKILKLPNEALKKLYFRGQKDNRNYIKDYLGIHVKVVKDKMSVIYSKPGIKSKTFLTQDELVTVLEEKGEWYRIEFEEDEVIKQGWVKKRQMN